MKRLSVIAFCLFLILLSSCKPKVSNPSGLEITAEGIPVIDLKKSYPEKEIILQEIADITYIPLENGDDILVQGNVLPYYSENVFITYNNSQGDIFVFDSKTGKLKCKFNKKGNSGEEYIQISHLAYDEKKGEIYVVGSMKKEIIVYSDNGDYIRRMDYPENINLKLITNYDDNSLLVVNGFNPRSDMTQFYHQNPYVFISKQTGEILSHIETNYSNRLADMIIVEVEQGLMPIRVSVPGSMKYGDEIIIPELASDTVFLYTKNREKEPLFIRTPSVWDEKAFIGLSAGMKTDEYVSFYGVEYDFDYIKREVLGGGNTRLRSFVYMFNLKTYEIFTPKMVNSDSSSGFSEFLANRSDIVPKNTNVSLIQAHSLITALEKENLTGKLKEVAEKMTDEDNPVLMVISYK